MRRAAFALAAILATGCSSAGAASGGPAHSRIWDQGYQYGQGHKAAYSQSALPLTQWCATEAYQWSGYSYLTQENQWAKGCGAALS
jgi:hypothetical protein